MTISARVGLVTASTDRRMLARRELADLFVARDPGAPDGRLTKLARRIHGMAAALCISTMEPQVKTSERHHTIALFALTTAFLVLVFAGVLFAHEGDAPAKGAPTLGALSLGPARTLTGSLHTVWGDGPNGVGMGQGGGHLHTHLLIDDKGRATKLAVPDAVIEAAGGRAAINHRRVTVEGRLVNAPAGSINQPLVAVQTLGVENPTGKAQTYGGLGSTGSQSLVSGSQKWVSVLCRFGDSANVTPYPKSWFETLMLGSQKPGLDHYWRENSYNQINLTGSVVVGWYTLPHPRSYYVYGNPLELDHQRAADDCTAAANADVFFPSFVGVNLMFNDDLDCCAWGGSSYLNIDGQSKMYRITWLPPWGYESQGPVAHEMGHGFGLPHSSGPYNQTYDSRWDVMSDIWGNCPPWDPAYGCVGTHTISYHKDLLGWIPNDRRYVAGPNTSQTITLDPLDQMSPAGNHMIVRIPLPGSTTKFYTAETRRLAGYDAPLPGHAVVIHLVDTTRSDRDARVVDPDGDGDPDDASAMWLPGETFTDATNNISIAIGSAVGQGYLVTVTNGNAGGGGGPTSYTLSVTVSGPGTVISTPAGISCSSGTCSATFASGSSISLSTSGGGVFSGWSGACSGNTGCSVSMTANRSVTATFSASQPDVTVSPLLYSYGSVAIGTKGEKSFLVKNDGSGSLVLGTLTLAGTNPDQFVIAAALDLCSGKTLAPGQSCTVVARFKPKTPGIKAAKLWIPSNDPDESTVKIALGGNGVAGATAPEITLTPASSNFGAIALGVKVVQDITVKNEGTADLLLGTATLSIVTGSVGEFEVPAAKDLCSGATLAPGQACTIRVKLVATSAGAKAATLSIPSNDADENPVSFPVSASAN